MRWHALWRSRQFRGIHVIVRSMEVSDIVAKSMLGVFQLLCNLAGVSAILLPSRLPNLKAMWAFNTHSRGFETLWDMIAYPWPWAAGDWEARSNSWAEDHRLWSQQWRHHLSVCCLRIPRRGWRLQVLQGQSRDPRWLPGHLDRSRPRGRCLWWRRCPQFPASHPEVLRHLPVGNILCIENTNIYLTFIK